MTDTTAEKINSKPTKKSQKSLGYTAILVILMIVTSLVGGMFGFSFGKKSLERVNPVPLGSKTLKPLPPKPKQPRSALSPSTLSFENRVKFENIV